MTIFEFRLAAICLAFFTVLGCGEDLPIRAEIRPQADFAPPALDATPDESAPTEARPVPAMIKPRRPSPPPVDEADDARIELNRATATELESLPGIGPAMAQRILDYREKRAFRRTRDLKRIRGIGPATFRKLEARVKVE